MNTRTNRPKLSILTLSTLSALSLMLAACGEQAAEQESSAPTTEESTEGTTQ